MNEKERFFLEDTLDISIGYDRLHDEQKFKCLISEIRQRIIVLLEDRIQEYEDSI